MTNNKVTTKKGNEMQFKRIIRIADADLDGSKKLEHALIKIKGISWPFAHAIRRVLNLPRDTKLGDLDDSQLEKLKNIINNPSEFGIPGWMYNRKRDPKTGKDLHVVASELILAHKMDIKNLINLKGYRGIRHMFNQKCRGQRTRSHGANVRGRVGGTVGVVRKKQQPGKKK